MKKLWWKKELIPNKNAIAYYRHSAQDKQENSIPIQKEQVHKFAHEHNVNIIKEFIDEGKSGLSTEGRNGFNDMLQQYVIERKEEFDYILVLDVSRWGRFQDGDLAGFYTGICKKYGIQVIYTTMGFPKEDDLFEGFVRVGLERYRAAVYSKELSGKVFNGCVKIAQQGFRAGAPPPYGLHRLLLDEQKNPVFILKPGQRKSIQNQRVALAPGDKEEIAVVNKIFDLFVKENTEAKEIAKILNKENILSPGEKKWISTSIYKILNNEFYIGTMVYNKTSQKLTSPTKKNPREAWVRKEKAFEAIVNEELFLQAQGIIADRRKKYSNEEMISKLKYLYDKYGMVNGKLIKADGNMVSPATYGKHFHSMYAAYQAMFKDTLEKTKQDIIKQLKTKIKKVEQFNDYIVLDDSFTILIQPSVPIAHGYEAYWYFILGHEEEIDLTLGVPLSNNGKYEILGYLMFPMIIIDSPYIKMFSSMDEKIDFYGYSNLDSIKEYLV
jgi:DNA invertase Pin-like site-specific DNA recombinase